jgi:hypothetical protein
MTKSVDFERKIIQRRSRIGSNNEISSQDVSFSVHLSSGSCICKLHLS